MHIKLLLSFFLVLALTQQALPAHASDGPRFLVRQQLQSLREDKAQLLTLKKQLQSVKRQKTVYVSILITAPIAAALIGYKITQLQGTPFYSERAVILTQVASWTAVGATVYKLSVVVDKIPQIEQSLDEAIRKVAADERALILLLAEI